MGKGKGDGADRERRARAKRTPAQPAALPVTEASTALAAALTEAGLAHLAARARRLEYDENYSRHPLPLRQLVADLIAAKAPAALIDRVTAGDFDCTDADAAAYAQTPRGRAEAAQTERDFAALPPGLRDQLDQMMQAVAEDPQGQQRLMKEHVATMQAEHDAASRRAELVMLQSMGLEPERIDASEVHPAVQSLLGARGPNGEKLDTMAVLAVAELIGRTGAREYELGTTGSTHWYASCKVMGQRVEAVADTPDAAAGALARKVVHGGKCVTCQRVITFDEAGIHAVDKTLPDGTTWTAQQQADVGCCFWHRRGLHYVKSCQQGSPSTGGSA